MKNIVSFIVVIFVTGCASQPKLAEMSAGSAETEFYQVGNEAMSYRFGIVDGKSFWGSSDSSAASSTAGPGAGALFSIVSVGAEIATQGAQNQAADILKKMAGKSSYVGEFTRAVMPILANKLHTSYDPQKAGTLEMGKPIEDENGYLSVVNSAADLAVVVEISEIKVTEKPSIGGLLKAAVTAGFNDKQVAPELTARLAIYKREAESNQLKRQWTQSCNAPVLMIPETIAFSELEKTPEKGQRSFRSALAVLIKNCTRQISRME